MVEDSGLKPVALAGFQGAFIRDLPKLAGRGQVDATSRFYRAVERWRPSLLSVRLAERR